MNRKALQRKGFTLLEALLATAISLMLLGGLYVVVDLQVNSTQNSRDAIQQATLARALMDRISRDMVSSITIKDPGPFRSGQLSYPTDDGSSTSTTDDSSSSSSNTTGSPTTGTGSSATGGTPTGSMSGGSTSSGGTSKTGSATGSTTGSSGSSGSSKTSSTTGSSSGSSKTTTTSGSSGSTGSSKTTMSSGSSGSSKTTTTSGSSSASKTGSTSGLTSSSSASKTGSTMSSSGSGSSTKTGSTSGGSSSSGMSGGSSSSGSGSSGSSSSSDSSSTSNPDAEKMLFIPGIVGTSDQITTFQSVALPKNGAGNSTNQVASPNVSGIKRISYWVVGQGDQAQGLARWETTAISSPDATNPTSMPSDVEEHIIAPEVKSMKVSYSDGSSGNWSDFWDSRSLSFDSSTPQGPPRAMKIELEMLAADGKTIRHYSQVVAIPVGNTTPLLQTLGTGN